MGSACRGAARPPAPGVCTPLFHDKNTQHLGKSQSKRPHQMWKRPLTVADSSLRVLKMAALPVAGGAAAAEHIHPITHPVISVPGAHARPLDYHLHRSTAIRGVLF
jgi:hypothetical protein